MPCNHPLLQLRYRISVLIATLAFDKMLDPEFTLYAMNGLHTVVGHLT